MFTDVHVDLQSRKKIQGYTVNVWFASILWTVMKIASLQAVHNVFMNTFKCSGKNTTDRSIPFCWTKKKLLIWTLAYITEEQKKVEKHTRSVTIGSSAHDHDSKLTSLWLNYLNTVGTVGTYLVVHNDGMVK